jgi:predicted cation transporter
MTEQIFPLVLLSLLLLGPLVFAPFEHNIEIFFLSIGLVSAIVTGRLDRHVVEETLLEPIMITAAVVIAGLLFRLSRLRLELAFAHLRRRVPLSMLAASSILVISLLSSVITAMVAALILVEIVRLLQLEESSRIKVTVIGCFTIGLGAALTPLGEPLSTLATRALGLHFMGLAQLLGAFVIPAMPVLAMLAGYSARRETVGPHHPEAVRHEHRARPRRWMPVWMGPFVDVIVQGIKVYLFVAGLVLIGLAYGPLASKYLNLLSKEAWFWANMVSAALDNATLVALEVKGMELPRAREAIVALLISGGMLIPGNVPNIICAGSLGIGSGKWARVGVPLGLLLMLIYFVLLNFAV